VVSGQWSVASEIRCKRDFRYPRRYSRDSAEDYNKPESSSTFNFEIVTDKSRKRFDWSLATAH